MIDILIEPSKLLIDTLSSKTAIQLIDIINEASGCESLAAIAIYLTAFDVLMQKYPKEYDVYFSNPTTHSLY